jgi:hypothetical protein
MWIEAQQWKESQLSEMLEVAESIHINRLKKSNLLLHNSF